MRIGDRQAFMAQYQKWIKWVLIGAMVCFGPLFLSQYLVSIIIFMGIYSITTLGLGLLIGYAGQVSLGHNAFYGLGAYTSGILSFRYGVSPWIGILCG
jgi:branched-chain amino acid transport system permease protein